MELLRFSDDDGREWEVWEVGARPPVADQVTDKPTPRWLCFASGPERRRLATYPPHWHTLPPSDLTALLRRATPARQTPSAAAPPIAPPRRPDSRER